MNCKITFKVPFLFFVFLCCSIFAQKKNVQGQDQIVFGRTYTIDDLKKNEWGYPMCFYGI